MCLVNTHYNYVWCVLTYEWDSTLDSNNNYPVRIQYKVPETLAANVSTLTQSLSQRIEPLWQQKTGSEAKVSTKHTAPQSKNWSTKYRLQLQNCSLLVYLYLYNCDI